MMRNSRRALAVDPTHRGFGFVVLEGSVRLLDWGVKDVRANRDQGTLGKVCELIDTYRPHVLVLEDCDDRTTRRGPRATTLIGKLAILAKQKGVRVQAISLHVAQARLVPGKPTKRAVAQAIVTRFPELAIHQPPERRPWMSEDDRQAVFDAITLTWGA